MRKLQESALALFGLSAITSIAGMEISGWLLFVLAIIACIGEPSLRKLLLQPVMLAAYGLIVWVALGLWWNAGNIESPWTDFAEMRWVLSLFGLTVACAAVVPSAKIEKYFWVLTGVAVLVSLYSISQYWTGEDWLRGSRSPLLLIEETRGTEFLRYRPYGLFKMTLTYACSYAMFGMIPFCLSFYYPRRRTFWLLQAAAAVIFLSVIMTFSRGVWISLGCGLLLVTWFLWRKSLVWAPVVLGALVGLALISSPALRARVSSVTDSTNESNSERVNLWRANLLMLKKHPFLGVGYEKNGPPTVGAYYRELGITSTFESHAHNNYLNFLSGTGLPGFLFYMWFILGALWITWQNVRRLAPLKSPLYYVVFASLGAQIVLHAGGLTEYNFGDAEVQYQYLGYVALNLFLYSETRP